MKGFIFSFLIFSLFFLPRARASIWISEEALRAIIENTQSRLKDIFDASFPALADKGFSQDIKFSVSLAGSYNKGDAIEVKCLFENTSQEIFYYNSCEDSVAFFVLCDNEVIIHLPSFNQLKRLEAVDKPVRTIVKDGTLDRKLVKESKETDKQPAKEDSTDPLKKPPAEPCVMGEEFKPGQKIEQTFYVNADRFWQDYYDNEKGSVIPTYFYNRFLLATIYLCSEGFWKDAELNRLKIKSNPIQIEIHNPDIK